MEPHIQGLLEKIRQSRFPVAKPQEPPENEQGKTLNPERRAENLRLLRAFLNSTQDELARVLRLGSQSYYSSVERGVQTTLTSDEARRIESDLKLPNGWFERNNSDALFLSPSELALVLELRISGEQATNDLLNVVRGIRTLRA